MTGSGQHKGPRQLFREDVTQTAVATDGAGNRDGFRGDLCVVCGMGSSVLPAVPEAVAVAVHL